MHASARLIAALTIAVIATISGGAVPSFAQPAGPPPPPPAQPPPPPAEPGAVVIVPPGTPVVVGQPVYGPPAPGDASGPPGQMTPGAPQNEPWGNVSNINGQIVKVGERGDYLYKWKTTSVAINPIGILAGFYGISVTHAVHPNIAIRADVNWIDFGRLDSGNHQVGHQFGLTVPIYLKRVFSGPFVELGVVERNEDCSGCQEEVGPEALFGWHWTFDSGLNVSWAVGALRDVNNMNGDGLDFDGYFRIGYAW